MPRTLGLALGLAAQRPALQLHHAALHFGGGAALGQQRVLHVERHVGGRDLQGEGGGLWGPCMWRLRMWGLCLAVPQACCWARAAAAGVAWAGGQVLPHPPPRKIRAPDTQTTPPITHTAASAPVPQGCTCQTLTLGACCLKLSSFSVTERACKVGGGAAEEWVGRCGRAQPAAAHLMRFVWWEGTAGGASCSFRPAAAKASRSRRP
jgi:hypothetical protein